VNQLRTTLLWRAALQGEEPGLSREAGQLARAWLEDRASVHPEMAWLALRVAARDGDRALFDTVLAQARATEDRNERSRLLSVLGAFREPALSREALALVAGSEFDLRDTKSILLIALFTPETRASAWDFYREHFDTLASRLRSDELGGLIDDAGLLCDERRLAEAQALLGPRVERIDGGPHALARALESIRLCIESERRHQPGVLEFLRRQTRKEPE
ncbi:MAG TPA: ERAP1-like C-terminal domain-containing protein, partial [Myxococcaceae bacterium]|nr:ERAP1-like C-terminal domain-containing protein [Myxococcaceae bacterium]